jgi:Pyridoxamine 5'-phosphate oxidase
VLEVLDRSACVELLQSVAVGRVAWATESGDAVVVPVNFVAVDDGVVFWTAEGDCGALGRRKPTDGGSNGPPSRAEGLGPHPPSRAMLGAWQTARTESPS